MFPRLLRFVAAASALASLQLQAASVAPIPAAAAQSDDRQRLLVLTDIEADPDDTQSLIRLLLYSNEIDIEGLVATTSTHKRTSVAPESIRALLRAYGQVRTNLIKHDPRYLAAESLQAIVKQGRPEYGMGGVGTGKDSQGSDWIISVLDRPDPRPLWVNAWGGTNTLAQALFKLRQSRPAAEVDRLVSKLRVYTISDQDDSGSWIRREFPTLFYIVSPGGYGAGTWGAINQVVEGLDNTSISNAWIAGNIQQGHGRLGAAYPDVAWGMEGDTPAFLALIPNGLNVPEHPDWGGWGGRYTLHIPEHSTLDPNGFTGGVPIPPETRPIWTNADDTVTPYASKTYGRAVGPADRSYTGFRETLWRWRDDFQNDFAARMGWTTKSFVQANHPPTPVLEHPAEITVKSGQDFTLGARGTTDPDGDSLSYLWIQYPEAGSFKQKVKIEGSDNTDRTYVVAPKVAQPETLHFILRVTDKGTPPLTRYKRVIVTVMP